MQELITRQLPGSKATNKGVLNEAKKTVAVVLHKDAYELLSPYIDPYVKEELSGKHIYGASFSHDGVFLTISTTPELTGGNIVDLMKIFIPLNCVKFMVEGAGATSIGFGVSEPPH